jgi:hypothetical protein
MELLFGLPVIAGLLYALYASRRVAKRNRRRRTLLQRAAGGDVSLQTRRRAASPRSEMRATGNPNSVMDVIRTTTTSPEFAQPGRSARRTEKTRDKPQDGAPSETDALS